MARRTSPGTRIAILSDRAPTARNRANSGTLSPAPSPTPSRHLSPLSPVSPDGHP